MRSYTADTGAGLVTLRAFSRYNREFHNWNKLLGQINSWSLSFIRSHLFFFIHFNKYMDIGMWKYYSPKIKMKKSPGGCWALLMSDPHKLLNWGGLIAYKSVQITLKLKKNLHDWKSLTQFCCFSEAMFVFSWLIGCRQYWMEMRRSKNGWTSERSLQKKLLSLFTPSKTSLVTLCPLLWTTLGTTPQNASLLSFCTRRRQVS